jgi:hypothetical protein
MQRLRKVLDFLLRREEHSAPPCDDRLALIQAEFYLNQTDVDQFMAQLKGRTLGAD